jgi:predicted secreted Zn-dependent protease
MAKKTEATVETTIETPVTETTTTAPVETTIQYAVDGSQGPELIEKHGSVSGAIRFLNSEGLTKGQIAKVLAKRFQHVRNVLITPLKKQG